MKILASIFQQLIFYLKFLFIISVIIIIFNQYLAIFEPFLFCGRRKIKLFQSQGDLTLLCSPEAEVIGRNDIQA